MSENGGNDYGKVPEIAITVCVFEYLRYVHSFNH